MANAQDNRQKTGFGESYKSSHQISEKLANLSDQTMDKVNETVDNIQKQGHEYYKKADEYLHNNPWKAIGIAAAVGAIVALLVRR